MTYSYCQEQSDCVFSQLIHFLKRTCLDFEALELSCFFFRIDSLIIVHSIKKLKTSPSLKFVIGQKSFKALMVMVAEDECVLVICLGQ